MACDPTVAETIETLTERLQTSDLLGDRRDAARGLRSLSKDYRVEVCAQAMEALLQGIKNDHNDVEMVNYCLDALNYIISGHIADSPAATWPEVAADLTNPLNDSQNPLQHSATNPANTGYHESAGTSAASASSDPGSAGFRRQARAQANNHDPSKELAEIFLKKSDNVVIILDRIIDNDFKTRWVCVRLLCGLGRQKLAMLQDCILSFPLGVSRLTQLITEEQELIRNDALVLFVKLTQGNQNVQNLVAFEGCLDKLIYIIELEGYLEGTVAVVMDCLNIVLNLVQYNESNQILFREAGHIPKMLPFFNSIHSIQWTAEKTACLILVLQIIDSLIIASNSAVHVQIGQGIMQRCGLLDKLCELLTAGAMPIGVLSETMNTASDIVRGHLGPNANMVMQTSSMMPVLLLSMVKEMCQDQEKRISDMYSYMHVLHDFVSNTCKK